MQTLRRAHWITRLVLVWFVLFIGAAVASALVRAEGVQMVCSGMGGMKLVKLDSGGSAPVPQSLDCPLCMPVVTPTAAVQSVRHPSASAYALHPVESARWIGRIDPPWQARAPPAPSV